MDKKGIVIVSEWIVQLVFLIIVILVFLSVNAKIKDNRLHDLRVETRDYAFTQDILLSSPYSLHYNYKVRENITLKINDSPCLIQGSYKEDSTPPVVFSCVTDALSTLKHQEAEGVIKFENE